MKLAVGVVVLAALAGCGALKSADPIETTDAGTLPAAPTNVAKGTAPVFHPVPDGGVAPVDPTPPPTCAAGICAPEHFATTGSADDPEDSQSPLMVSDGTNIYFRDEDDLVQCPATGCTSASRIVLASKEYPNYLVVVGDTVYWNTWDQVHACAVGGCSGTPTALVENQLGIGSMTTDGTSLYWGFEGADLAGALARCTIGSCSTASVTVFSHKESQKAFIVADGIAYWEAADNASLETCSVASCQSSQIGAEPVGGLATDGTNVFWGASGAAPGIYTCAAANCAAPTLFAASPKPGVTVTDGKRVFWTDATNDALYSCPTVGCPAAGPEVLANALSAAGRLPVQIAVGAEYIYWPTRTGIDRLKVY